MKETPVLALTSRHALDLVAVQNPLSLSGVVRANLQDLLGLRVERSSDLLLQELLHLFRSSSVRHRVSRKRRLPSSPLP